ncbi:MAG: glutamine synthetase III [Clostridia bacterium]|nr:glutamine synthetase III [Clostridia bacterium]
MGIPEIFAENVFNERVMKERLPETVFQSLQKTIECGERLDIGVANVVATAMKDWAVEKGATHYTHWFQPMTGVTAEKHDSFISPKGKDEVIMEFSGKELVVGEPDASSFPSGGIRATFEARGYTAWDPTSYAFVREGTLYIPTAFCSYTGEVLDKKTPLLRSMNALNKQVLRILKLFGHKDVTHVTATVGAEQEYFLIDRAVYERREDLKMTGRTLFGAMPPKGQELEDHYFGALKERVAEFMKELDTELWKLGILAKTKHNEVAPAQHELAPIFSTTNVATDHNQLTMELMKKIAQKHGMVCLLHEKPFDGINGSGKHNNWSVSTSTGVNLFDPGKTPADNAQFMLFLTSVIKAVDEYQDLLRISVAGAGNDHRLGGHEAPPAIISIFLGEELQRIVDSVMHGEKAENGKKSKMRLGVDALPEFPKDSTDRNRTSPFAFTGNKFEFRMLGSSFSVAGPNIVLNTIVAEQLEQFADILEKADDFNEELQKLVAKTLTEHQRIIFNGNGYSAEWEKEAGRRGLLNLRNTAEALPYYVLDKNVKVFEKHGVFTAREIQSRMEILQENYSKITVIEAKTMADMAMKSIYPAVNAYVADLCEIAKQKSDFGADVLGDKELISSLSLNNSAMLSAVKELLQALAEEEKFEEAEECSKFCAYRIVPLMDKIRHHADEMEKQTAKDYWPMPDYLDILFSVE